MNVLTPTLVGPMLFVNYTTNCRKREEEKAHSERKQEFAGRKHRGRQDKSMGLSNTGDYVSFTINIRPLGVALRSAYARGRPSR